MNKYITTFADGMDLVHINIWDHPVNKKTIVAKCVHNEAVMLIDRKGDQSKVKLSNGKEGWCNTAFLTDTPTRLPDDAERLYNPSRSSGKTAYLFSKLFGKK